jgi:hypothetical protein
MANELNIALPASGLTVTAQRYQSGSAVGSAISLTEVGSSGFYSGTMTGSAGTYQLAFVSAGANVGSGSIVWSGSAEVPASTFNPSTDTVANVTLCATTTTLTNAPTVPSASAIASQVRTELSVELGRVDQNISSRLAAADYVAPSAAPTVTAIRQEMDANSTKLANLDASISSRLADADYVAPTSAPSVADIRAELAVELGRLDASVSSRLAGSAYTAPTTPPTAAEIAIAVEGSLLNEGDGQQVLNAIVGAIGNTNLSEVSLVAAVRADLERNGGKLDSIPTTAAPSASAVASATRTELSTELSRIDQSISSRLASADYTAPTAAPTAAQNASAVRTELSTELARIDAPISGATAPSAATVASAVRTELSTELGRVDAAISTRLASSAYTAPANSDISAIKSKTDNLPASPAATGDIPSANIAAIKAKTDALNTERLANVATTNIVGTLLAQANS